MSRYVDGFVIPVPRENLESYREIAERAGGIWKEHGALEYWECVGDDLDCHGMRPFPEVAGAGPDDVVLFSWIVYESREHRDAVNALVMADPRISEMGDPEAMPFDCQKMAYGGFIPLVRK